VQSTGQDPRGACRNRRVIQETGVEMPLRAALAGLPPWIPALFEIHSDALVGLDEAGRVCFVNRAAARLAGREPESATSCLLADLLPLLDEVTHEPYPPRALPEPHLALAPVPDPRTARRRRVRIAGDDEDRVLEAVLLRFAGSPPDPMTALLVLRDRSAQLRAERALRASDERYCGFMAHCGEGVWRAELTAHLPIDVPEDQQIEAFYRDGVIAEANQVLAGMYGLSDASALIGKQLRDVLPPTDPASLDLLRSFIRSGYHLSGDESQETDGDGVQRWFLRNVSGIVEDGCLVGAWGTQVEITAQKRREEELRRRADDLLAADRRKNQFLNAMAHEMRNPLAPIRNSVELLRQAESGDPSFRTLRTMVERQVQQLAHLVDDLLDVSRITHGNIRLRKEPVDLRTVVERAIESTRPLVEMRGHLLTLDLPPHPLQLDGDAARLEQVIANLLTNAAKYTMPEGQIWLTLEHEAQEATVSVRDTGIGIPPDGLARIFEPFVQGDNPLPRVEGGLGIGLALVRSLIEMHGGSVEAHSRGLGQGSEFVVRLPLRAESAAEPPRPALRDPREAREMRGVPERSASDLVAVRGPAGGLGSLRVLVVEDNVDAAESLASLLRLWRHQVSVVQDGQAAIELARAERPQVVLLDIGLPGLDGYQVARRLRNELGLHETLVVAMTGYSQPEDRRRSREAGIQYHFVKPVEPVVLQSLLAALPVGAER
jgi:PAS domain S-box-containing protein